MSKTENFLNVLRKVLINRHKYQELSKNRKGRLLKNIKWEPDLILKQNSGFIAVDINLSNAFPVGGAKEITKVRKKAKNLDFYFFVPREYAYDQIFSDCFKSGFGILSLENTKLITILEPDSKEIYSKKYSQPKGKKAFDKGHIPKKLLEYFKDLQHISYNGILKDFAVKYSKLKKGKTISKDEYDLVDRTIKKIFDNKQFHYSSEPYLRLKFYEPLLSGTREHYLHSFQVMLMGCVIIDKFYEEFKKYYKNVFPNERKFSIEYIWLLVSIFHDIGYPSQKANSLIGELYGYPEEVEITGIDRIIDKNDYVQAAIQIQSFIRHCCYKKVKQNWAPEIIEDEDSTIKDALRELLLKRSHGITSCFQFLTSVLRESKAVSKRASRPLIVTHVIPAVTSIALHDNKIWRKFKELKIFPLNITNFPFAVLLIFLDSLHDWKRNNQSIDIPEFAEFDGFVFKKNCIEVNVHWNDVEQLARKLPEYNEVMKNLKFNGLKFKLPDNLLCKNG